MDQYVRRTDEHGRPYLATSLPGLMLTRLPLLNKGTAFTLEEREEFGLTGLYPAHVSSLEEQVARSYDNFRSFGTDLDKHVYLRVLQDRNEVLYYALLATHLEETMPIIYTPTVALAVERFSHIYRFPRGLIVNRGNIDRVDELLADTPFPDVRLIVATDSEGILGIGDQGVGGMAICIGKLSIYTAAAGIDPAYTLPVKLDVGTNSRALLDDPFYLGAKHERLSGDEYHDFIERFVLAVKARFPRALLQWEDFSKQKAFDVHERYASVLPSFNDDIQGTGAVVLAGLLAGTRLSGRELTEETYLVHGAGAGGVGVARQVRVGLERAGLAPAEARARVLVVDSRGLVLEGRPGLEAYKRDVAQPAEAVAHWRFGGATPTLLEAVREAKVTALLGLSGQGGAFTEEVVRAVAQNSPRPIVFALSNPTTNTEAAPEHVYDWTGGRAIVATGSPFPDVRHGGRRHVVGQGNNAYVFPGIGLGALLSGASRVTPGMLTAAAEALAGSVDDARLRQGAVYPTIERLRDVSRTVAAAVMRAAADDGVATEPVPGTGLEAHVESSMWRPEYVPIRRA